MRPSCDQPFAGSHSAAIANCAKMLMFIKAGWPAWIIKMSCPKTPLGAPFEHRCPHFQVLTCLERLVEVRWRITASYG